MKVEREKARDLILERVKVIGSEVVTLDEAYGRVLAQTVESPIDIPDEDKSAIDGFAFNFKSLTELPATLKVVGEVQAGTTSRLKLKVGEAAFVMTGGVIPEGADTAVRLEDVEIKGDTVRIPISVKRGNLINFRGSEIKKGETLLEKGERLDYRKVGLLAHVGIYRIKVYQKLKVGLISTGNELLEPEEPFKKGCVRNTNFYILKGLIETLGGEVVYFGKVGDREEEIERIIDESLSTCNFTVTTGGVSKGKYDFVKRAVRNLNVNVLFEQTNIRPGRPFVFGYRGDSLFFGLPGYPAATLVNALEFLVPALRKSLGMKEFNNYYLEAIAGKGIRSRVGRVDFVRVILEIEEATLKAFPLENQQTSNFRSIVQCQGLAVIGKERGNVKEGEKIEVLPLNFL